MTIHFPFGYPLSTAVNEVLTMPLFCSSIIISTVINNNKYFNCLYFIFIKLKSYLIISNINSHSLCSLHSSDSNPGQILETNKTPPPEKKDI